MQCFDFGTSDFEEKGSDQVKITTKNRPLGWFFDIEPSISRVLYLYLAIKTAIIYLDAGLLRSSSGERASPSRGG